MKTWICVKPNVWGISSKMQRMWKVGETIAAEECPNKHFMDANPKKVEAEFEFNKKAEKEISVDDMNLMTKKQINEKFALGIKQINTIKKEEMIVMALKKNPVFPR